MPILPIVVLAGLVGAAYWFSRSKATAPATAKPGSPAAAASGWSHRASGVVAPGEYYFADFFAPANWTDATLAQYKLSLAALGFTSEVPAGRPLPPSPTGDMNHRVVFQGRFIGPAAYDLQGTFPGNSAVVRAGAVFTMPAA